jgi:uncharacterized protein YacL
MKNETIIPKRVNLLGNIMTFLSFCYLGLMFLGFLFSSIPKMIEDFSQLTSNTEKTGAILGNLIAAIIAFSLPLNFATIHSKFKKYINNKLSKKIFLNSYIFSWIIIVLAIFVSLFSRSIPVIITFLLVFILPIIYLINIHKYTKNDGLKEI